MDAVHEEIFKNHLIKICQDDNPESPRKWDNLSVMVCFHSRYNLGDDHDFRKDDYNSWEDVKKAIIREHGPCLISPLYLYDHSGISISMGDFGDKWDLCCVGFIFVPYEKIRKEYSVKRISKAVMERAQSCMAGELKCYDDYLTGNVYGFQVFNGPAEDSVKCTNCNWEGTDDDLEFIENGEDIQHACPNCHTDEHLMDGEELESCWGFYGDYEQKGGPLDEARSIVNAKTDTFRNAIRTAAQQYDQQQKAELADKLDAALEHQKELNLLTV